MERMLYMLLLWCREVPYFPDGCLYPQKDQGHSKWYWVMFRSIEINILSEKTSVKHSSQSAYITMTREDVKKGDSKLSCDLNQLLN